MAILPKPPYPDMPENHWAYNDINLAKKERSANVSLKRGIDHV
jgi:hypothetical protein